MDEKPKDDEEEDAEKLPGSWLFDLFSEMMGPELDGEEPDEEEAADEDRE